MQKNEKLYALVEQKLGTLLDVISIEDCVTIEVHPDNLLDACSKLYNDTELDFKMLIDVCGVDYMDYGITHWRTQETTSSGFSRAVVTDTEDRISVWEKPRFASVCHLLSLKHNWRIRIKSFLADNLRIPSLMKIWPCANWYEREAFDLYGIQYEGHPDLRRILTDYGFKGHPFRKDFPLIGHVELRYDAEQKKCIYEPVSIQPRVLVPKVIRTDSRYASIDNKEDNANA